jgi:hypothetical protein
MLKQAGFVRAASFARPKAFGLLLLVVLQDCRIATAQEVGILRHRDFAGEPCLAIKAIQRAHIVNPDLYDHVVDATNHCGQTIRARICYSGTDHCLQLEMPPFSRKQALLGAMIGVPQFHYDLKEQF